MLTLPYKILQMPLYYSHSKAAFGGRRIFLNCRVYSGQAMDILGRRWTLCVFLYPFFSVLQIIILLAVFELCLLREHRNRRSRIFRTEELSARVVCLSAIRITSSVDPMAKNLQSSLMVGTVNVRILSETHLSLPQTIQPRHLRTQGIMAVVHDVTPQAAVGRHRRHNAEFSTSYFAQLAYIRKLIREIFKSQSLSERALGELPNLPALKQKQRSSELWNQFFESIY